MRTPDDSFDMIAAGSEFQPPISNNRASQLNKIVNEIFYHTTVAHNCSGLELKLVANHFKTLADNLTINS